MSGSRVATLPFEHLPNLPRAVIPTVELQVDPVNWDAVYLEVDGGGERLRTFTADRPTQTEETELGEVKEVARVLDELLQVGSMKKSTQGVVLCAYLQYIMSHETGASLGT